MSYCSSCASLLAENSQLKTEVAALLASLEKTVAALEYLFTREGYPPDDASCEMMQAAHAAIAATEGTG